MKKFEPGQILGLVANLGVIAGILLLVFELNQNRDMMRAQIRNELARGLNEVLSLTISDFDLSNTVVRANSGEALSETESLRLNQRSEVLFRYWENVHYQYRQGLYDESEFSRQAEAIASVLLTSPSLIQFWCRQRGHYSAPFTDFFDEMLAEARC